MEPQICPFLLQETLFVTNSRQLGFQKGNLSAIHFFLSHGSRYKDSSERNHWPDLPDSFSQNVEIKSRARCGSSARFPQQFHPLRRGRGLPRLAGARVHALQVAQDAQEGLARTPGTQVLG